MTGLRREVTGGGPPVLAVGKTVPVLLIDDAGSAAEGPALNSQQVSPLASGTADTVKITDAVTDPRVRPSRYSKAPGVAELDRRAAALL